MKRTITLFPWYAGAALMLLTLPLFSFAGCSGGGDGQIDGEAQVLDESEIAAIRKTTKNRQDFTKALHQKLLGKDGVLVPTKTSGKVKKKVH